jgi:hypothetical protein
MSENQIIFDLTNETNNYKGVLFAEGDNSDDEFRWMNVPQKLAPGVMSIIWVDEEGTWNQKTRLKFPLSGSKQVYSKNYKKEQQQRIKVNETYVLNDIYKFPMINKIWTPNPSGEPRGIIEIMQKIDMIEYSRIEVNDPKKGDNI